MFNVCFAFIFFSELAIPTVVVLNTSNQQYFLLDRQIKDTEDMVQFISSILDGTVEVSRSLQFRRYVGEEAEGDLMDLGPTVLDRTEGDSRVLPSSCWRLRHASQAEKLLPASGCGELERSLQQAFQGYLWLSWESLSGI